MCVYVGICGQYGSVSWVEESVIASPWTTETRNIQLLYFNLMLSQLALRTSFQRQRESYMGNYSRIELDCVLTGVLIIGSRSCCRFDFKITLENLVIQAGDPTLISIEDLVRLYS